MCFQAIDSIHQVGVYCLALVPANILPKTPLGGIHISETKQRFLEGSLHPCNVLMCPHTCVTNLPKPRQKQPGTTAHPDPENKTFLHHAYVSVDVRFFNTNDDVLDRGWSCFYDCGQPGGRKEDSASLWERPGATRGQ